MSGQSLACAHAPAGHRSPSRRRPRVTVLGVIGELLVTAGLLALLYVVWELWWTNVEVAGGQEQERSALEQQFQDLAEGPGAGGAGTGEASSSLPVPAEARPGQSWGLLYVPALGEDEPLVVAEGTQSSVLDAGLIGRYADTPDPGEPGNLALAGHRQSHGAILWNMDRVDAGDLMVLQTRDGYYTYEVVQTEIVKPHQTEVLDPDPLNVGGPAEESWLTLTTCHPPYTTLERMVSHARLVEERPLTDGPPEAVVEMVDDAQAHAQAGD